jgi:hypothetical protein
MAEYAYPRILKDDYKAFRKILPELPEAFEKWEADLQSKKAKDRLSHEAAGSSFASHDEIVNGGRFVEYCEEKKEPPTITMLYRFASECIGGHG